MAYATVSHVQSHNPLRKITATSTLTATQVVQFIEEIAGVLDGILAERGYAVPLPLEATSSRMTLQHLNGLGAACLTERAAPTSDRRDICAMWDSAKAMLADGVIELVDAPFNTQLGMPSSGSDSEPFFTRDQEF